jgi:hypothetical protein
MTRQQKASLRRSTKRRNKVKRKKKRVLAEKDPSQNPKNLRRTRKYSMRPRLQSLSLTT